MNRITKNVRLTVAAIFFVGLNLSSVSALAQQDMSVEKLEEYIQEQKALLEETIGNRDDTKAKVEDVKEELAEQEARREQLEAEVDELCQQLDQADPGSYDDCKAQFSS